MLFAKAEFNSKEKFVLRWHERHRFTKAVSDYAYIIEDERNRQKENAHITLLEF